MDNFLIYSVTIILSFLIAEFFGRGKHIGRWWSFILLISGFIFGVIALIASPSAKSSYTEGKKWHKIVGWVLLIIGISNLIFAVLGSDDFRITHIRLVQTAFAFIPLGIYLIKLSKGHIINTKPKYYLNSINKDFSGKLQNISFQSQTKKPDYLYHIIENDQQSEPLTFDQLKDRRIVDKTLIWRKGLDDWVKAEDLTEIKSLIYKAPPPIPIKKVIEDKYLIKNQIYTLFQIEESFKKGNYLFGRDDEIKLIKNDDIENSTKISMEQHEPLQQFQSYFPPKI